MSCWGDWIYTIWLSVAIPHWGQYFAPSLSFVPQWLQYAISQTVAPFGSVGALLVFLRHKKKVEPSSYLILSVGLGKWTNPTRMYFVWYGIQTKKSVLPIILILHRLVSQLWSVQVHAVRISEMRFLNMSQSLSELHYKDMHFLGRYALKEWIIYII